MIEFGLKHYHSSEWKKKFPRKKVKELNAQHLGMTQHLRLRNEWREGRRGYLSWKDIEKFLEKHIGENVDKVFSEYIKRAKRFDHDDNLKERFYANLKPDRFWRNSYTLDNEKRIIKSEDKRTKRISNKEASNYNKEHLPESFLPYMKDNELTYIGHFYIRGEGWNSDWKLTPIFITSKEWYNTVLSIGFGKEFVKYSNMSIVAISVPESKNHMYSGYAYGIPKKGFDTIYESTGRSVELPNGNLWDIKRVVKIPYTFRREDADFIFLAKN